MRNKKKNFLNFETHREYKIKKPTRGTYLIILSFNQNVYTKVA